MKGPEDEDQSGHSEQRRRDFILLIVEAQAIEGLYGRCIYLANSSTK
ncbi:MAG: hypothetical protein LUQ38_06385 [Methanotrichaceae archaeon]|nr:hypothetical protein [Methanotrichaceae archaeon]